MRAKDWMTQSPITVPPSTPVFEALRLMDERRIRHLPVVDGEELVGIVSDRDLRLNPPSPATGLSVREVNHLLMKPTVGEVMTKTVLTVGASWSLEAAAQLMRMHRIGALPVLEGGRVVGILTQTDLLRALVSALTVRSLRGSPAEPALPLATRLPCHDVPADVPLGVGEGGRP